MKTMKKAFAFLLVVMMLASVCSLSAFAETAGTITVKASENGTTYNFYRIFDLAGQDTDDDTSLDAVTYSLNDKWKGFFVGAGAPGAAYIVDDDDPTANDGKGLNTIDVDGVTKYINIVEGNVVDFTNAAMQYALGDPTADPAVAAIAEDATATGTGSDLTVNVDTLGYYLMIPMDASIKNSNSSGSVASLTSTNPDAEVNVKAEKPKIEKTDDTVSAEVGQTVTYSVTGTVPNTAGYETYVYKISDEMTSGLTFQKDVVVKIGETDVTESCTIDYTTKDNAFTADIPVKNLQDYVGQPITLTYHAVVNDDAVASKQEKNKATLEYGHNPDETTKTTPIEEEVYTAKIVINKYTGDDPTAEGKKLKDAKFALMNADGKFYKYTAATEDAPAKVEWVALENGPAADDTSEITVAQAKVVKDAAEAETITGYTTDVNGAAEFKGIADGTYYLVEFEAPAGYNRLLKATKVTVEGTNVDGEGVENIAQASQTAFDEAVDATADIKNNAGTELPSTGGIGTTIFYVVGGLLLVGAGVLLVTKKRMEH